jgi:hypothetical protein
MHSMYRAMSYPIFSSQHLLAYQGVAGTRTGRLLDASLVQRKTRCERRADAGYVLDKDDLGEEERQFSPSDRCSDVVAGSASPSEAQVPAQMRAATRRVQ